jgi:hypothetical protein
MCLASPLLFETREPGERGGMPCFRGPHGKELARLRFPGSNRRGLVDFGRRSARERRSSRGSEARSGFNVGPSHRNERPSPRDVPDKRACPPRSTRRVACSSRNVARFVRSSAHSFRFERDRNRNERGKPTRYPPSDRLAARSVREERAGTWNVVRSRRVVPRSFPGRLRFCSCRARSGLPIVRSDRNERSSVRKLAHTRGSEGDASRFDDDPTGTRLVPSE